MPLRVYLSMKSSLTLGRVDLSILGIPQHCSPYLYDKITSLTILWFAIFLNVSHQLLKDALLRTGIGYIIPGSLLVPSRAHGTQELWHVCQSYGWEASKGIVISPLILGLCMCVSVLWQYVIWLCPCSHRIWRVCPYWSIENLWK